MVSVLTPATREAPQERVRLPDRGRRLAWSIVSIIQATRQGLTSGGRCHRVRKDERSWKRSAFLAHALVPFDVFFACRPWATVACRM